MNTAPPERIVFWRFSAPIRVRTGDLVAAGEHRRPFAAATSISTPRCERADVFDAQLRQPFRLREVTFTISL